VVSNLLKFGSLNEPRNANKFKEMRGKELETGREEFCLQE
jgi:hypothetical protein